MSAYPKDTSCLEPTARILEIKFPLSYVSTEQSVFGCVLVDFSSADLINNKLLLGDFSRLGSGIRFQSH